MTELTPVQIAVANAIDEQSWFVRRKDTIAAVAGTILQILNLAAFATTNMPEWANLVIAVLVGVCQVFVHAATKGAITPSMAGRLEATSPAAPAGTATMITQLDQMQQQLNSILQGRHSANG